jgi:hypothetical protein
LQSCFRVRAIGPAKDKAKVLLARSRVLWTTQPETFLSFAGVLSVVILASRFVLIALAPNLRLTPPGFERISPAPKPMLAPPVVPKSLPANANTPYLVNEVLKVTNFEDLLSMLSNATHSEMQKALIYSEIKSRRDLTGNRQ